jgi:5-formyltetrahydrofolate cyclo-ligase
MNVAKQALREAMVMARLRLSSDDRASFAHAIARHLLALTAFERAQTLGLYAPIGAEVDTTEIAQEAAARGKRLTYPRLVHGRRALEFVACREDELRPGALRTREPPLDAPAVPVSEIDTIIVPGVAFDASGNRLGRGRGHYDATLASLPPHAVRVGLAFEVQIAASVPREEHDVAVDVVVTEAAVRFRPRAGAARSEQDDSSH